MIEDERFLPIGTVVLLKEGTKPIMINGFCVIPKSNKNGIGADALDDQIYDYGGCPYPQGMIDMQVSCVFNHDQIREVVHYGYDSEEHDTFSEILNEGIDTFKEKYKSGELKKSDILINPNNE